jgi:hypothetical protein
VEEIFEQWQHHPRPCPLNPSYSPTPSSLVILTFYLSLKVNEKRNIAVLKRQQEILPYS